MHPSQAPVQSFFTAQHRCKLAEIAFRQPFSKVPREPAVHRGNQSPTAPFDDAASGCYHRDAGWSSLVARWAHNPKVGGSNPPPATNAIIELRAIGHLQQLSKTVQ